MKRLCGHAYTGSLIHDPRKLSFGTKIKGFSRVMYEKAKHGFKTKDLSHTLSDNTKTFKSIYCPDEIDRMITYDISDKSN